MKATWSFLSAWAVASRPRRSWRERDVERIVLTLERDGIDGLRGQLVEAAIYLNQCTDWRA